MESDYAILRLKLVETIPAYELSRLTSIINDIYDIFLEIEEITLHSPLSPIFIPGEEERLYIKKASIGTPNCIEFLGIGQHLLNTVTFLAENYNESLKIKWAYVLSMGPSDSIYVHMNRIKELFESNPWPETQMEKVNVKGSITSLDEALNILKKDKRWDNSFNDKKNEYINYVKNISSISQNIITQADLAIIKSKLPE